MRALSACLRAGMAAAIGLGALMTLTAAADEGATATASAKKTYSLYGGKGRMTHHVYGKVNGLSYDWLVYTPVGWKKSERLPLYLVLHGCASTATDMAGSAWLNPTADQQRFVLAYPDNGGGCWRAVSGDALISPTDMTDTMRGGGGEADIVANMTKRTIRHYGIDTSRVYMAGGSAGAFQTASTAIAYPEIYTAIGIVAGGGPGMAVTCAGHQKYVAGRYAEWAFGQMGKRAHVMPFFVIGGTLDPLGNAGGVTGCSELAYQEMLYLNNLIRPSAKAPVPGMCGLLPPRVPAALKPFDGCTDTYMTNPRAKVKGQVKGGLKYIRNSAQDTSTGCEIGQQWIVKGMFHTWPGPSGDLKSQGDPRAPSASLHSWDFFKRFRLVNGQVTCRGPLVTR
jgi:poly(3-hydroxybutyrate) depolymerase